MFMIDFTMEKSFEGRRGGLQMFCWICTTSFRRKTASISSNHVILLHGRGDRLGFSRTSTPVVYMVSKQPGDR
jgi:hypothetical protein